MYTSKLNIGLMSGIFSGNIVEVAVGKGVEDEGAVLYGIVKDWSDY